MYKSASEHACECVNGKVVQVFAGGLAVLASVHALPVQVFVDLQFSCSGVALLSGSEAFDLGLKRPKSFSVEDG